MTSLRGMLRLARVSLALSPIADGLAGASLAAVAGAPKSGGELAASLGASLACFVYGMIGNDLCDREVDRARGGRPLSTGEVSPTAARIALAVAAVAALGCAFLASGNAPLLTIALLAGISLYNSTPRHLGWFGPPMLGAIRGTNLLLGASTCLAAASHVAIVYAVFIAAIAIVGRMEDGALAPSRSRVAICAAIAASCGVLAPVIAAWSLGVPLAPAAVVAATAIPIWLRLRYSELVGKTSDRPLASGPALARFVGASLATIYFFDAALALSAAAPATALILLAMFPVSRLLVRSFPPS